MVVKIKRPMICLGDGITANFPHRVYILEVQRLLGIEADGQFGKKTKAAVVKFQKSRGLTADGVIGAKTWAALRSPNPAVAVMGIGEPDESRGLLRLPDSDQPRAKKGTVMGKLGTVNKMWVAGVVSFVCQNILMHFFQIDISPTMQAVIVSAITMGFTWLVPNKTAA